jgi:hypothetical protein
MENPTSLLHSEGDQNVMAMQFVQNHDYTTFIAEHAFDGNDIVFHFYPSPEHSDQAFWKQKFPDALSDVAQAFFQATYPRLKAAFTPEQNSWWMRANGFANVGLPTERVAAFYAALDQALETRNDKA